MHGHRNIKLTYHVYRISFNIKLTVWHLWTSNNKCRVLTNKLNFFTHYHYFSHIIDRSMKFFSTVYNPVKKFLHVTDKARLYTYVRSSLLVMLTTSTSSVRSSKRKADSSCLRWQAWWRAVLPWRSQALMFAFQSRSNSTICSTVTNMAQINTVPKIWLNSCHRRETQNTNSLK